MGAVAIGLDLGQRRDPTAIAVAEREDRVIAPAFREVVAIAGQHTMLEERPARTEDHFVIRHLERLPLGTAYPEVAARVAEICTKLRERTGHTPRLYVDATGVGLPVVDELRRVRPPAQIIACFFTHGDRRTLNGAEIMVGKAWLVSRLQALLQSDRLHLPKTAESEALAKELLDYEIRIDQNANDTYGAFKVGTHDDLVTALGLAAQPVQRLRVLATF